MRIHTVSNQKNIDNSEEYNIVMLGAGNVSTHISRHLHFKGHRISCIYSRTFESASDLAVQTGARPTSLLEEVPHQADFYLVCLPDHAVAPVINELKKRSGIFADSDCSPKRAWIRPR